VRAANRLAAIAAGIALVVLAGGSSGSPAQAKVEKAGSVAMWVRYPSADATTDAAAALGKQIFFDASLSASGRMACATCHDPAHAYGPPSSRAVQPGGATFDRFGTRTAPSLRYLQFTPKFSRHLAQPSPDGVEDEGPAGGFTRDGAAQTLRDQALIPLLNPDEMANADVAAVNAKLRAARYAAQFQQLYGATIFERPAEALAQATAALEAFETQDPSFRPYTSKFDAAMSGNARFTAQELRGYTLFNNPQKGNCAKCHLDAPGPGGRPAQFTDFGHVAIGVPRNMEIAANRDPHYFDLGLCGPIRKDLVKETNLCGMFKTPTLRNSATRKVFFHNGRFHNLSDVLHFYAERDTNPAKWYPRVDGKVVAFDDLPPAYRANIDHVDVPFTRSARDKPLLDAAEIADIVAFMRTLDDGYSSVSGGAKRTGGESCYLC
jgi:cytochrome c peroxidase